MASTSSPWDLLLSVVTDELKHKDRTAHAATVALHDKGAWAATERSAETETEEFDDDDYEQQGKQARFSQTKAGKMISGGPCANCGVTACPQWRKGAEEVPLCNRCGMQWRRYNKLPAGAAMQVEETPLAPPSPELHAKYFREEQPEATTSGEQGCPAALEPTHFVDGRVVACVTSVDAKQAGKPAATQHIPQPPANHQPMMLAKGAAKGPKRPWQGTADVSTSSPAETASQSIAHVANACPRAAVPAGNLAAARTDTPSSAPLPTSQLGSAPQKASCQMPTNTQAKTNSTSSTPRSAAAEPGSNPLPPRIIIHKKPVYGQTHRMQPKVTPLQAAVVKTKTAQVKLAKHNNVVTISEPPAAAHPSAASPMKAATVLVCKPTAEVPAVASVITSDETKVKEPSKGCVHGDSTPLPRDVEPAQPASQRPATTPKPVSAAKKPPLAPKASPQSGDKRKRRPALAYIPPRKLLAEVAEAAAAAGLPIPATLSEAAAMASLLPEDLQARLSASYAPDISSGQAAADLPSGSPPFRSSPRGKPKPSPSKRARIASHKKSGGQDVNLAMQQLLQLSDTSAPPPPASNMPITDTFAQPGTTADKPDAEQSATVPAATASNRASSNPELQPANTAYHMPAAYCSPYYYGYPQYVTQPSSWETAYRYHASAAYPYPAYSCLPYPAFPSVPTCQSVPATLTQATVGTVASPKPATALHPERSIKEDTVCSKEAQPAHSASLASHSKPMVLVQQTDVPADVAGSSSLQTLEKTQAVPSSTQSSMPPAEASATSKTPSDSPCNTMKTAAASSTSAVAPTNASQAASVIVGNVTTAAKVMTPADDVSQQPLVTSMAGPACASIIASSPANTATAASTSSPNATRLTDPAAADKHLPYHHPPAAIPYHAYYYRQAAGCGLATYAVGRDGRAYLVPASGYAYRYHYPTPRTGEHKLAGSQHSEEDRQQSSAAEQGSVAASSDV